MSKRLILITGSGISAESGIPTFRDKGGTWNNFDVSKVANYAVWKENFDLVHNFYNSSRLLMNSVKPNHTHEVIAEWHKNFEVIHFTQNVDLLLEDAGCTNVHHVHGIITQMRCEACGNIWDIGVREWNQNIERCECSSRKGVKPNVVFFGENAPLYDLMYSTISSMTPDDVFVALGTKGEVIAVDNIAEYASNNGVYCIVNALDDSFISFDTTACLTESNWNEVYKMESSKAVDKISYSLSQKLI